MSTREGQQIPGQFGGLNKAIRQYCWLDQLSNFGGCIIEASFRIVSTQTSRYENNESFGISTLTFRLSIWPLCGNVLITINLRYNPTFVKAELNDFPSIHQHSVMWPANDRNLNRTGQLTLNSSTFRGTTSKRSKFEQNRTVSPRSNVLSRIELTNDKTKIPNDFDYSSHNPFTRTYSCPWWIFKLTCETKTMRFNMI